MDNSIEKLQKKLIIFVNKKKEDHHKNYDEIDYLNTWLSNLGNFNLKKKFLDISIWENLKLSFFLFYKRNISKNYIYYESTTHVSKLRKQYQNLIISFKSNNNDFDNLLIDSKKKETNINPIGVISSNKKIKPLSSNTLVQDRKNIFSLYHNVRILLDIKRNLKNLLITSPVIENDTVLFSLNSTNSPNFNLKGQVSLVIEQFLQSYVDRRIIKEFYVDLSLSELNSKSSIKDNLEKWKNQVNHLTTEENILPKMKRRYWIEEKEYNFNKN